MIDPARLRLNDESAMRIECRRIGKDRNPLLIIDNVFADPEYVRNLALSLHYLPPNGGDQYSGLIARISLDRSALDGLVLRYIAQDVCGLKLTEYVVPPTSLETNPWFKTYTTDWTFGVLQSAGGLPTRLVHADDVMFALLVYLNLPHQCSTGTAFYSHRGTGIQSFAYPTGRIPMAYMEKVSGIPFAQEYRDKVLPFAPRSAWHSDAKLLESLFGPGLEDNLQDFERLDTVEMKFNRLVAYPGWQLHALDSKVEDFGTARDQQRLSLQLLIDYLVPIEPEKALS